MVEPSNDTAENCQTYDFLPFIVLFIVPSEKVESTRASHTANLSPCRAAKCVNVKRSFDLQEF